MPLWSPSTVLTWSYHNRRNSQRNVLEHSAPSNTSNHSHLTIMNYCATTSTRRINWHDDGLLCPNLRYGANWHFDGSSCLKLRHICKKTTNCHAHTSTLRQIEVVAIFVNVGKYLRPLSNDIYIQAVDLNFYEYHVTKCSETEFCLDLRLWNYKKSNKVKMTVKSCLEAPPCWQLLSTVTVYTKTFTSAKSLVWANILLRNGWQIIKLYGLADLCSCMAPALEWRTDHR